MSMIYLEGALDAPFADQKGDVPGPDHVYSAVLSSSRPVNINMMGESISLVLDHDEGSVDLGRMRARAPILVNHDPNMIAGHVVDAQLSSQQLFIDFKLSANELGRSEALLIQEGTRSKMSVGAQVLDTVEMEQAEDGSNQVTIRNWEPVEGSLASVPRNVDASILNSIEESLQLNLTQSREWPEMPEDTKTEGSAGSIDLQVNMAREEAARAEQARIRELTTMGRIHHAVSDAERFVTEGKSVDEFRELLLDRMADDPNEPSVRRVTPGDANIGLSAREMRQWSWGRAIRALSFPDEVRHQQAAGFERECSMAVEKVMGLSASGILIPNDVLTMTGGATQPNEGAEWVQTDKVGFIENLRNRSVLMGLNPMMLTGLTGNVSLRTKTGSSVAYWTAEGGSSTQSPIPSDQKPLSPKRLTVETAYDKQLLVQTNPSVNAVYEQDMVRTAALEWDRAALYGSGANNQPVGVVNQSGFTAGPTYTAPGPTFDEIVALETALAADNADIGDLAYVMASAGRGHLKSTTKFPSAGDATIWEPGDQVNGYRTGVSNQVLVDEYWFANWADLILAQWGAVDLTANPYIRTAYNEIVLYLMMYVDIGVRHIESFTHIKQT